jgi:hypothetical protein
MLAIQVQAYKPKLTTIRVLQRHSFCFMQGRGAMNANKLQRRARQLRIASSEDCPHGDRHGHSRQQPHVQRIEKLQTQRLLHRAENYKPP